MRVAIVGSRSCGGLSAEEIVAKLPPETTELVSGGAVGVDSLAEQAAVLADLPIRVFRPDYAGDGRLAPLVRNTRIADYADLVLAFWDYRSKGTAHILNYCIRTEKPIRIFSLPAL